MFKFHTSQEDSVDTTIATNCVMVGVLRTTGSVIVAGVIEGSVEGAHVQILKTGRAHANVHTTTCIVHGELNGSVHAGDSVLVSPTAKVTGDIEALTIRIEQGAYFKGSSNTVNDSFE